MARRSNQSIVKEINPEYSLERLMLKLKLQYFGHLMLRADPLEETLMLGNRKNWRQGGEGDNRGWDGWMASLTQWTLVWANSGRYWRTGKPGMLQFMGSQRVRHDLVTEKQQLLHAGCFITDIMGDREKEEDSVQSSPSILYRCTLSHSISIHWHSTKDVKKINMERIPVFWVFIFWWIIIA